MLRGRGFDQYFLEFSDISWPMEEASLIRFSLHIERLYKDLADFLEKFVKESKISINENLLTDLISLQKQVVVNPDAKGIIELNLCADIPEFIHSIRSGEKSVLKVNPVTYYIDRGQGFGGDKKKYAHEVVWFGRKGGKYFYPLTKKKARSKETYKTVPAS